jgi:pyridoxal phosphate enzyme (YggS family)
MPPLDHPTAPFHDRLQALHQRIRASLDRAGRTDAVRLVGVTKTVAPDRMNEAFAAGLSDFGESKVQEALDKWPTLTRVANGFPATSHFIGHLQTNKARKALELFDVIQSVDRPRLAETLNRIAAETGATARCLIEIKISDEPNKTGVPLAEAGAFVSGFSAYRALRLEGLMTIGPNEDSEDAVRGAFRQMKAFFDGQKRFFGDKPVLSMGMSDDFEIAIEEGSTLVRVGRALFGERTERVI